MLGLWANDFVIRPSLSRDLLDVRVFSVAVTGERGAQCRHVASEQVEFS